jgi:2,5-diamino-6-(ribosylamino)-4(3H)-pyrimidinone 5'-phosphate reductase
MIRGGARRPYVICHMCTTIDGKILSARWGRRPGGQDAGKLFERTAASFSVPAWLVGTTTMKEFAGENRRLPVCRRSIARTDHLAQPTAKSFAIGADAKGVLRFQRADVGGDHVVLLVTEQVSADYLAHLQAAGVSYLFCGRSTIGLPLALHKIRAQLKLRRLMLEGGGRFNGAMLRDRLVDEISQVIVPVVDGAAEVTSMFEIPGLATKRSAATLRLLSRRALPGGVQWLRYRVASRPPRQA